MVVLLKNCTRELRTYNVGDKGVTVKRIEEARTRSGQAGTRTTSHQVSSSITLMPGEPMQVPHIILKQRAVQQDIAKGVLKMVEQKAEGATPKPPPLELASEGPLPQPRGSHPVEEEGTVNIDEFKAAQKAATRSAKETKA